MENKDCQLASPLAVDQQDIEIFEFHTVCRLCANSSDRLMGIFGDEGVANDLASKINTYMPVKVALHDELPLQCCWSCASTLLAWHELVLTSMETDRRLRHSQLIPEKPEVVENNVENAKQKSVFDDIDDPDPVGDGSDGSGIKEESKVEIEHQNLADKDKDEPKKRRTRSALDGGLKECDLCGKTVSRSRDLKRHKISCKRWIESLAKPSVQTKKTSQLDEMKKPRYRRSKDEIIPQFFCDLCDKGFTRKHDVQKHKNQVHLKQAEPAKRQPNAHVIRSSDGKKLYNCDFCHKSFAQNYSLMRHRTVHTGVKAYCCHICGKRFRVSNGLKRHIEGLHQRIKKFNCGMCEKSFTTSQGRNEHLNIHTNDRPYVCDECGKRFKQKASLYVHKMFHTEKYKYQCHSCDKKFMRPRDLMLHSWVHTGHKPYECDTCNKGFRLKHELARHRRVHQRGKGCVCEQCGSAFSQERYLKMHVKIHQRSAEKAEGKVAGEQT